MSSLSGRKWTAEAPSNIALIKYMGKTDSSQNRPTNTSLSYTLPHLRSLVQLEYDDFFIEDTWEPLLEFGGQSFPALDLNEKGRRRFIEHFRTIKYHFGFEGCFRIRSANDFPSDCGLASSASSFAALTKVAMIALSEITEKEELPTPEEAARWSQKGSGSSCRSFFGPWSIWTPERVSDVPELGTLGNLIHQVVVVDQHVKAVSSSEAHRRVSSSLLFAGRPERADMRVRDLIDALEARNWESAFELTWAEFWDMHALFETSESSFGYMTASSIEVLRAVRKATWDDNGMGPLITMDAGPNIHLLYKRDDRGISDAREIAEMFKGRFRVISNLEKVSRSL